MKSKKFTYLLGLLVLIVWGIIIYRVFDSATGDSDENEFEPIESKNNKIPLNDYALPRDTARLLLNYRDPFGLIRFKDTVVINVKKNRLPKVELPKPGFSWAFIKYSGYIRNPGSKKLLAVVIINDRHLMMQEGEMADGVRLIKNLQDSIKVSFKDRTSYIKIQSGSL